MTLALRLAKSGRKVTIFESANEIGGLAAAWEIGDVVWDKHYHVTLASDKHTRKIVDELGLGDEFRWVETKTGFYTDGELVSMSNTMEFLKFPPLGLIGKLRLGATIFAASRLKNWKRLEKISVEKWLTRLSGRRTFEKIWKPLLKAKLGDAYKETSSSPGSEGMVNAQGAGTVTLRASLGSDFTTSMLTVTESTPALWEAGRRRYIEGAKLRNDIPTKDLACTNCHGEDKLDVDHTPARTGGYTDEELITIFTEGRKPEGVPQRVVPDAEAWRAIHQWSVTEEEKIGMVWFLWLGGLDTVAATISQE